MGVRGYFKILGILDFRNSSFLGVKGYFKTLGILDFYLGILVFILGILEFPKIRHCERSEAISFKIPSKIPKPCVIPQLDHSMSSSGLT